MVSSRLAPFGSTIFSSITARARAAGAVDLGQGYPSWEGPDFVKRAAIEAITGQSNQYPPSAGLAGLQDAIATRWARDAGLEIDPQKHVTVTSGCTEALAASFLGLCEPGDEVILFEPSYDAYPVGCALAGAQPRFVSLVAPDFRFDPDQLEEAITSRTRMIVVNTPHNPTGRVFDQSECELIARIAIERDLIVVTDEVYEHIVYRGSHLRLATLPGMWERTLTLSSLGKSFSLTGWKTGWGIGPESLTNGLRAAHQYLTFTTPNPMQAGAIAAMAAPDSYFDDLVSSYRHKRDLLVSGLESIGFGIKAPEGAYYILADHSPFGFASDIDFVDHLISAVGVAAIPPSVFYHRSPVSNLVRFAFCKDDAVLTEALSRMSTLG